MISFRFVSFRPKLWMLALLLIGASIWSKAEEPALAKPWAKRAAQAQADLTKQFWNERASLYRSRYPGRRGDLNYWWQAHAVDVLVDGYQRTGDAEFLKRADRLFQGVVQANRGITIDYYDDMQWMALALLRLHEHSGDEAHIKAVRTLWKDIQTGWNDQQGGGIAWRKEQLDYKNTPANAPAVILAARLYRKFGDEQDLAWAKKIYRWQRDHLVDAESGFVWDGMNRQGDGRIDKRWAFSYNQGVYIGANLELFRATEDPSYRQEALRTARAAIDRLTDKDTRVFTERGGGDGGLFKGILIRYLTDLIQSQPGELTEAYRESIYKNADSLWQQTAEQETVLFGPNWSAAPKPASDANENRRMSWELSSQLSGIMLIEAAAKLNR